MPRLFDTDRGGFGVNVINFEASTVVCSGRFALYLHRKSARKTSACVLFYSGIVNLILN